MFYIYTITYIYIIDYGRIFRLHDNWYIYTIYIYNIIVNYIQFQLFYVGGLLCAVLGEIPKTGDIYVYIYIYYIYNIYILYI